MSGLDWSKTDVKTHPDSPWLSTPPTAQALAEYRPNTIFRPSEIRNSEKFAAEVAQRTLFGHPKDVKPIKPDPTHFLYSDAELSPAPPPSDLILIPPLPKDGDPTPTANFLFPQSGIWTLKRTNSYQRGWVYTTPYYLHSKDADRDRMLRVEVPPQLFPQVEGGVPFAYEIDGKPDELHTIGADTVLVAKGLRGCRPVGNAEEIFPISHFPIKTNDRSPPIADPNSKEGSYNLASTRLKGIGPGVFLPAAQVDVPEFRAQVGTVLKCLSRLRRRLMRKTVSKSEYEVTEFNANDMNVVGFGGLEGNNATSCQLNMSKIWSILSAALGLQGSPHPDPKDETTQKTHFLGLLSLPPDADPGAFLLARSGLYIRELNTWALHIFFDGVDIHSGVGATTTQSVEQFQKWVEEELDPLWNRSDLVRLGVVSYASSSAWRRDTYMSMTPDVRFGNFGPEQHHLSIQRDFATHGEEILGGQEPWANRMGREIVYRFWNELQLCNLDLGIDLNTLTNSITFKNSDDENVALKELPFHPVRDAECINLWRGYVEHFQFRQRLRNNNVDPSADHDLLTVNWQSRSSLPTAAAGTLNVMLPGTDFCGSVVQILEHVRIGAQGCFRVLTDDTDPTPRLVQQNDPRLPREMVDSYMLAEVKKISSVPILEIQLKSATTSIRPPDSTADDMPGVQPDAGASNVPGSATESSTGSSSSTSNNDLNSPPGVSQPSLSISDESTEPPTAGAGGHPDSDVDMDYDVEEIIGLAQRKDGNWYQVKFVGFEKPEWTHENELSAGCTQLLNDFYKSLAVNSLNDEASAVVVPSSDDESPTDVSAQGPPKRKRRNKGKQVQTDSDSDSSDQGPPKRRRSNKGKQVPATDPDSSDLPSSNKGKQVPKKPIRPAAIELGNMQSLEALLDADRMVLEVQQVNQDRPSKGKASKLFFTALNSQSLVLDILETSFIQRSALATLDMVVENSNRTSVEVAGAQFTKLATSAGAISQLTACQRATSLLTRILRWTNARSHIVIYRWCTSIGPETIKALFERHREFGFAGFTGNHPLGLLVDHIVQFIYNAKRIYAEKGAERRAQSRKTSTRAANSQPAVTPSLGHGNFGPVPPDLTHIPSDLYGLLGKGAKKSLERITLSAPGAASRLSLYAASERCLADVFEKVVIMPALRACNNISHSGLERSRKDDDDNIFARAICRGAVLDCIVEACGDDGILSSNALDDVFQSPWLMFPISRADRLGPALLARSDISLSLLKDWLGTHIDHRSVAVAKELGDEIHTVLQEMLVAEPASTVADGSVVPKKAPAKKKGSRKAPMLPHHTPANLDAILGGESPKLVLPALIIREALNLERDLAAGNPQLRRLLQGQHTTQNSKRERNIDHVNPRRQYNKCTELFQAHLPAAKLTGPVGLSNALAWFGTGQGAATTRFLDSLLPTGGFFSANVETMIQKFQIVITDNAKTPGNLIQYDNQNVWGQQPNQMLLAQPSKQTRKRKQPHVIGASRKGAAKSVDEKEKYTLNEKFDPKFSDGIQQKWAKHLGDLYNCDPHTYTGSLPGWTPTLELVKDLGIPAFKSGLTAMQLVNTLVFSGVVEMPSVQEMAVWISCNQKLGAAAGLRLIGFHTDMPDKIQGAYICFHNYLATHLTSADKWDLGFNPIFSEHLLCKTPRWQNYLKEDKGDTLEQMAAQLGDTGFISGKNCADPKAMPFPINATTLDLKTALEDKETMEIPDDELQPMERRIQEQPDFVQGASHGGGRLIVKDFSMYMNEEDD
ncbi:hypothetical protein C8R44DRAFT_990885 [Mycena epipterygia]|nr:hypothetical protein C8R44DRAFT_990885 [Mycena epipterygia]